VVWGFWVARSCGIAKFSGYTNREWGGQEWGAKKWVVGGPQIARQRGLPCQKKFSVWGGKKRKTDLKKKQKVSGSAGTKKSRGEKKHQKKDSRWNKKEKGKPNASTQSKV